MPLFAAILNISSIFIFLQISAVSGTPQTFSVPDALAILKESISDGEQIREFFHNHISRHGDMAYCGKPASCAEWLLLGFKTSGKYDVHPKPWMKSSKIEVYCDMKTNGGGWTVIQRRAEYPERQVNFTRKWDEYVTGFGNVSEEFWLGNDNIHVLTTQENVALRIELKDFDDDFRFAEYDKMEIGGKLTKYLLTVGNYSGTAGDSLIYHSGKIFSTIDRDNDKKCANTASGAWWYGHCYHSNLNGRYMRGENKNSYHGISWHTWHGVHYSLKHVEMKIRPRYFVP